MSIHSRTLAYFRVNYCLALLLTALVGAHAQPAGSISGAAAAASSPPPVAVRQDQPTPLAAGQTLEREMTGAETHRYVFTLQPDEFFQVRVEQNGVDVALTLLDADGNTLTTMDSPNSTEGPEILSFVADKARRFELAVSGFDAQAVKGNYTLKRAVSRPATPSDKRRVEVEKLFVAGMTARDQASQSEIVLAKLEAALQGWQELQDEYLAELTQRQVTGLKAAAKTLDNDETDVRQLKIGETIERPLKGGETHLYVIELKAGQVLHLDAQEKGVDLKIRLFRRTDKLVVAEADFGFGYDRETLTFIAVKGGVYIVGVMTSSQGLQLSGSYRLAVQVNASAETTDRNRQLATELLAKGLELQLNGSDTSLQYAISTGIKSLTLWHDLHESYWEGFTANFLGLVHDAIGEKQEALKFYNLSLPLNRVSNDTNGEASTLHNVGKIFVDLGEYQEALKFLNQALPLRREVGDKSAEAITLTAIGGVYSYLGKTREALKFYQQALPLSRVVGDRRGEATTLSNIGVLYSDLGEKQKALEFLTQALPLSRVVGDRNGEARTLTNIGAVYFALEETAKALDYFQQALTLSRAVGDLTGTASTLNWLQYNYYRLNQRQLAIFYGKQSVNAYQQLRASIKGLDKSVQQTYVKSISGAYRNLADILIGDGRLPEAQAVLDLIKEQEYRDLTRRRSGEAADTLPYSQAEADAVAKVEQLAALLRRQAELQKQQPDAGAPLAPAAAAELARVTADIETANRAFRLALDHLAKVGTGSADRVAEIKGEQNLQRALTQLGTELNTGVVALYTLLGTETATDPDGKPLPAGAGARTRFGWIILVTPGGRKVYPIDVTDIEQTVFRLRTALSSDRYDPQPLAAALYTKLFRQTSAQQKTTLEQDLQQLLGKYPDKTLMWSLDGVLRYVPMAALHDGKQYLVENYRNVVFTKQSLLLLTETDAARWQALGLGVSEAREGFEPLPGAERELRAIIREPNTRTGVIAGAIRLNRAFDKTTLLNGLSAGGYPVVHIASHYSFNTGDQSASFLLLGDGGHLTFGEMQDKDNLFGKVDLLTLSACDTGVAGNGTEAEGFAYLAQGLGAKAVIATLWQVSDVGTPALMTRFYRTRAEQSALPKAEALRQAQLALLRGELKPDPASAETTPPNTDQRGVEPVGNDTTGLTLYRADKSKPFAHPFYWAPFVLIGNWR